MDVDDMKLLDDVEWMQRAEGFVPSVWCNPTNGYLLGVKGFEILPAELNCESRIVLVTMDATLDRMQLPELMRFFKLHSHRSSLQDDSAHEDDVVWDFKCACTYDRGVHLANVKSIVDGSMAPFVCHRCGADMAPMVRVFHEAYLAKKKAQAATS